MTKRKLQKALKRLKYLPRNKYFFLYVFNKLKHFYLRLIKSTRVAYPSTIMLELTNHCNLRCTTCPREYDYGKAMDKGYMTLAQAQQVIDELWPYLDSIGLTGMGETLIFKELEVVASYVKAKNKGIIISLSTNAMLPDFIERVKPLITLVDTIQVSIDGLDEVYNNIRRNANFDALDRNLSQLVALCHDTDTSIMLNMVVTKENYRHMYPLVEYTGEKNIKYVNFTLFNLSSVSNIEVEYYEFYKTEAFRDEFDRVEKARKEKTEVEITNWDFKSKNEFKKCPFPWTHFYVCWDGYIAPCCAKPFPKELNFGNIFESNVMSVLNSDSFRNFRTLWYKNQSPAFCKKCHFIDLEA